ncbi:MAG: thiamine-phosphate kinase [Deltaproteobacteria bacterium]|nr:thiamine-phosphate kinase [Deltaproteobacteria bacterium]
MKLRDLGEFGLIDLIQRKTPRRRGVRLGIGDDAAWVSTAGDSLLFTSDLLIEGVHFNREWISMRDLGHKSLTASLSDIAAMGGRPAFFLLSLALPDIDTRQAAALVDGIQALAAEHRVALVGGDTCAADRLTIDVFLAGEAPHGAVTRAGARVGDDIYVTGTLGDSALGLALLSDPRPKVSARDRNYLVGRHHRPSARVKTGMLLAREGLAHAMMDVSDGLAQDLGHICRASRTGAVVHQARVPLSPAFVRVAGPDDLWCALAGGEDYELLFTAAPDARKSVERVARRAGVPITRIGECVPRKRGVTLVDAGGECAPLSAGGYDHFRDAGRDVIPANPQVVDRSPGVLIPPGSSSPPRFVIPAKAGIQAG